MTASDPNVLLFSCEFQARGSCAYTLRLAEHLPNHGISVSTISPAADLVRGDDRRRLKITEYAHLELPFVGRFIMHWMLQDVAKAPPDLIHIQSRSVLPQGSWLARHLKRPFVLTIHDYLGRNERLHLDWKWCKKVITVSESVRRDFRARTSAPAGIISVIPSGVNLEVESTSPPPLDVGHVPVIGTAGPLEAVKGLPFFLGAAKRVLATGRDVEFLVAGAGPEEGNLRRLARNLGIAEKVTFVPYFLNFTESLKAMDIFCLPSLQQGLGTIMLEAMAMGRPVIASRVGGVYSVIHDQDTGLLVPPSDSGQLAEKMLQLLCDPFRARALGEAGRQMVNRDFGLDRMVTQTAELYRELVAANHAEASASV